MPVDTLTRPDLAPPRTRRQRRDRFRGDIEGLRAVAVVLVVAFHAGVGVVAGGLRRRRRLLRALRLPHHRPARRRARPHRHDLARRLLRPARAAAPPARRRSSSPPPPLATFVLVPPHRPQGRRRGHRRCGRLGRELALRRRVDAVHGRHRARARCCTSGRSASRSSSTSSGRCCSCCSRGLGAGAAGRGRSPSAGSRSPWWSSSAGRWRCRGCTTDAASPFAYFGLHTRAWELGIGAGWRSPRPMLPLMTRRAAGRRRGWLGAGDGGRRRRLVIDEALPSPARLPSSRCSAPPCSSPRACRLPDGLVPRACSGRVAALRRADLVRVVPVALAVPRAGAGRGGRGHGRGRGAASVHARDPGPVVLAAVALSFVLAAASHHAVEQPLRRARVLLVSRRRSLAAGGVLVATSLWPVPRWRCPRRSSGTRARSRLPGPARRCRSARPRTRPPPAATRGLRRSTRRLCASRTPRRRPGRTSLGLAPCYVGYEPTRCPPPEELPGRPGSRARSGPSPSSATPTPRRGTRPSAGPPRSAAGRSTSSASAPVPSSTSRSREGRHHGALRRLLPSGARTCSTAWRTSRGSTPS